MRGERGAVGVEMRGWMSGCSLPTEGLVSGGPGLWSGVPGGWERQSTRALPERSSTTVHESGGRKNPVSSLTVVFSSLSSCSYFSVLKRASC